MDVSAAANRQKRVSIGFLNWAHAIDHYVLLIFPTVVIGLEAVYGRPYSELIILGTACFAAFGIFSLPAGWLADRWSRRYMMAMFFIGCGLSMAGAAAAPDFVSLAAALFALGMFAAIYHPVGIPMVIDISNARGRSLAFNGVSGNLGAALAAGITAAIASWLGWRAAFMVPAVVCVVTGFVYLAVVPDDSHRTGKRQKIADVALPFKLAVIVLSLFVVTSLASGLIFNTVSVALPKIVDERLGEGLTLNTVGWIATAVFMCGAVAQIAMGRLVERFSPLFLFAGVVTLQLIGIVWSAHASGAALVAALALTMATIYGQVTVSDVVIARYTADAWRGRFYAVKYFLTFTTSAAAVAGIGLLHARGGFDMVLLAVAGCGVALVTAVYAFVLLVTGAERRLRRIAQPAE